jgi:hypothetical protein
MSGTTGVVPGANDYALYNPALGGANTSCVFTAAFAVDRINMHSSYTDTLFVLEGVTVAASTQIDQRGGLVLTGGTISSGGSFYVNGTVAASAGPILGLSSVLDAGAGLYLNDTTAPITVTGGSAATPGLILSSNAIDCVSDITLGTALGAAGALEIEGSISALSYTDFTLYAGSDLVFDGTITGSTFQVQGTIFMYDAAITTDTALKLDGGTLHSRAGLGNVDEIAGDVTLLNGGTINVGTAAGVVSTLSMTTGSLTANSATTINLHTGSLLTFPAATGISSTVSLGGTLNMYGAGLATITSRVASISLSGTLNSLAGGTGNAVAGNLSDGGIINVGTSGGTTSSLTVTGSMTVTSGGNANVYTSSTLSLIPTGYSGLQVQGQVNMYGGTIACTAGVNLAGGTLYTRGSSSGGADTINGSLTNNGTLRFEGALHSLSLSGYSYSQGSSGTLVMRIKDPAGGGTPNDSLDVSNFAILGGTLTVTAQGTLPQVGTWVIITTGSGIVGNFATLNLPPGRNAGVVGNNYEIT